VLVKTNNEHGHHLRNKKKDVSRETLQVTQRVKSIQEENSG